MGFRGFSLVTGDNGRPKQPARRRPGNAFATALSDRMLQMHVDANIIEDGVSEPFGCSSILVKPKCKAADKLTTIEQVEEATDKFLALNYRFIIDLGDATKSMSSFSSPLPNPRSTLAQINSTHYYSALDLLAFFHQCHLSRKSRNLHTFISTGSGRIRQAKRSVMGSGPSLGAGGVITSICWPFLTSYVDNLYIIEKNIQSMYEKFLQTHVVARSVNAVFKISDSVLLVSARDGQFSILGYLVSGNKLMIPKNKVDQLAQLPRTRRFVVKLISSIGYYAQFSSIFGDVLAKIRTELSATTRKFVMTQRLERLIYALLLLLRYNEGLSLISPADFAAGQIDPMG